MVIRSDTKHFLVRLAVLLSISMFFITLISLILLFNTAHAKSEHVVRVVDENSSLLESHYVYDGDSFWFAIPVLPDADYALSGSFSRKYYYNNKVHIVFENVTADMTAVLEVFMPQYTISNIDCPSRDLYTLEFKDDVSVANPGETLFFRLTVVDSHNRSDIDVFLSEKLVYPDANGFYSAVINSNLSLRVSGLARNEYAVNVYPTKNTGLPQYSTVLQHGSKFTRLIENSDAFELNCDGAYFDDNNLLTVNAVTDDMNICITTLGKSAHIVQLVGDGFVTDNHGEYVEDGDEFISNISAERGYRITSVSCGELTGETLTLENVTSDTTITVTTEHVLHAIEFPTTGGYNISAAADTFHYNDLVSLTLAIDVGYYGLDVRVLANNTVTTFYNGTYRFIMPDTAVKVTVEGVSPHTFEIDYALFAEAGGETYTLDRVTDERIFGTPFVTLNPKPPNGYVFTGWYTDTACTTLYEKDSFLAANITLYTIFTFNAYALDEIQADFTYNAENRQKALSALITDKIGNDFRLVCFLDDYQTEFKNAGIYDIEVYLSAEGLPEQLLTLEVTIKKALLTVTATPVRIQADETFPDIQPIITGFLGDDTENALTSIPALENIPSEIGVYSLTLANGEAVNYNFEYTPFDVWIQGNKSADTEEDNASTVIAIAVSSTIAVIIGVSLCLFFIRKKRATRR